MRTNIILTFSLILFTSLSLAKIINIPADQPTIGDGIDAAIDGDTVLVAPGEYFENINFNGKAIFLSSYHILDHDTSYISGTIINGSGAQTSSEASVVTFSSGEDTNSVLNGFTITSGTGSYFSAWESYAGGGIYITSGAKIINNYIIKNNMGLTDGQDNDNVIIQNNLIAQNKISGEYWIYGGGISITGYGNTRISKNRIRNNTVEAVHPIDDFSGGGGVSIFDNNPVLINNLIVGNDAQYGAGILGLGWENGFNFRLINNTIADNNASIKGGGVYLYNGHCTAINNIFWNNTAPDDPDIFHRSELNITYSITQEIFPGVGNIQTDPLFENDLFYLSDVSPAIDGGNPDEKFNDTEDPENPGFPLWPAKGSLTADMGAFGGNETVVVEAEDYLVQQNFLYKQFEDMHYRFSYPLSYDSSSVYPLSIVLHGSEQWGSDNELQLLEGLPWRINSEHYAYNDFTIVPQAPNNSGWNDDNNLITVYNIIRYTIENFPIDTTKIVITGWSRGGGGTWQLLNLYPQFFSAAIPISGTNREFGEIKYIPVWVNHGSADGIISVTVSRNYIAKFENTGLTAIYAENSSDIQISEAISNNARLFYSEFEGAGHSIVKHAYDNSFLYEWLKKQARPLISPINSIVNKSFIKVNKDSVRFRTAFSNPYNFHKEHSLIVENFNKEKLRNISLYDDGLHGDSLSQDGIWGNYLSPFQFEDNYRIGIQVNNLDKEDEFYFHDLTAFTTIGPVVYFDWSPYFIEDSIPNPGDFIVFKLHLKNEDVVAKAKDIAARIYSYNPKIIIHNFYSTYGDIGADNIVESKDGYRYEVSSDISSDTTIYLSITISSGGYHFWSDSMLVDVVTGISKEGQMIPTTYALKQNYPNPFNPNTIINYQLPMTNDVELSIYNLLGQKVSTLVHERQQVGYHQVEWDASRFSSGIYYYKIEAGNFQDVKKMILIK
jgi:predicted esterase